MTDSRNRRRPAEPSSESASFDDLLQASAIAGRLGKSYHCRAAVAETSLLRSGVSRAETRIPIDAEERNRPEPGRRDSEDPQEESRAAAMTEFGVEPATPDDHPVAADTPSGFEVDDEVASPAGGDDAEGETCSAGETQTAVLSFSLCVPLPATSFASASQPDAGAHTGVAAVSSGPAATPTPTESVSIDSNSAQAKVHPTGEGVSSRPSSLLVPQAVLLDGGDGAGVNGAQPPADAPGSDASSLQPGQVAAQATKPTEAPSRQSPASPTQAPGDAAQPSPIAVAAGAGTDDAGGDDLSQGGHGFPAAAGGHAVGTRASGTDGPLAAKPVAAQLGVHIGKAVKAGLTRVEIALEPASLGKVEVRLDFGRDGRISAMFVAETREALDALRADARTLERALSEAGVKTDSASLDFSLREHGAGTGDGFRDRSPGSGRRAAIAGAGELEAGATLATEPPAPLSASERRLDIRA
jgi:hypothetical protein